MVQKQLKTDFSDYMQIDMHDINQVGYWTEYWNISIQELIRAAKAVDSTIVSEIQDYLNRNRREAFEKTM